MIIAWIHNSEPPRIPQQPWRMRQNRLFDAKPLISDTAHFTINNYAHDITSNTTRRFARDAKGTVPNMHLGTELSQHDSTSNAPPTQHLPQS